MKRVFGIPLMIVYGSFSVTTVWACAVCFGDPNSQTTKGVFFAMYLLLGFILFVLGGIAATGIIWSRRAKTLDAQNAQKGS